MIYLNDEFARQWAGKDPFETVESLEGRIFRKVKSRRTLRFEMAGKGFFAKIQGGAGWGEILKNLMMFKSPVLGARNEYDSILKLEELGIATMKIAAFGQRGNNPAKRQSFIITEELTNTISLEDFCRHWPQNPPSFILKKRLIEKVAHISRRMHSGGVNHRDFYICHFLLDISSGRSGLEPDPITLFLIDLHRTQLRAKTPLRWIVKDISGLWFSAMDIGLTRTDRMRFMMWYHRKAFREMSGLDNAFWQSVHNRACRLYRKETGKRYGR